MKGELTISESAEKHFKNILSSKQDAIGVRLALKKSGCSGFAYVVDLAESAKSDEIELEISGIKFFVTQNLLDNEFAGIKLDYVTEGINQYLKFINPNVDNECGCGESVTFKEKGNN